MSLAEAKARLRAVSRRPGSGLGAWVRAHPVQATLFALALGVVAGQSPEMRRQIERRAFRILDRSLLARLGL